MPARPLPLAALLLAGAAYGQTGPVQPATPAERQAARPQQSAGGDEGDEEIVVTGQKPPGSVVGDIPPEATLSPADVRAYGVNSIADLLDQLSPQTGSVRGRGGEAPVVLLNGRRISGFGEIRDLPTEAIARVEILPEEVALKYGFSADQKVVNFVLRQRFRSRTLAADGGSSTEGGGATGNVEAGIVRIQRDDRFNANLRLQQSDRLLESQRGLVSPGVDATTDLGPFRSLRPRTRTATLNTVLARPITKTISGSLNATFTATDSASLQGLPSASLTLPAASPFGSGTASTVLRTLDDDPLHQRSRTLSGHVGATANATYGAWRLNLTGNYDHADGLTNSETGIDTTALQARLDALDPAVNPRGTLTPYLGGLLTNRATSNTDSGNLQLVANGKLAELPAGALNATFKAGGTFQSLDGRSTRAGILQETGLSRQAANGQVNIDLPIASRRTGFLKGLGNLTANANLAVNQLSDFGTQRTYGYGINWSPRAPLTLIASFTDDEGAPTVQQLGNPIVVTAQSRVFDYLRGQSVDVVAVTGGNPALRADDRKVMKLGATWKPLPKADFTINASYVRNRIRDAIATLPEPTADIERAFPDRFVRDAAGNLLRIDTRATNFSRERQQQLRWGFNLAVPLKPSKAAIEAFRAAARARFGNQPPPGLPQGDAPPPPPPGDAPPPPPPGDGGPPPGGGGFGGGGFGGPPGGGGPGGPGGGFGGGGFGGGGFGRGGGGRFQQNAGGRLQLTVFHTWTFQDDILIRPGVPEIDLLDGGSVTSNGGSPRHQIDAQLGYSNNGIGARLSETWRSGTRVDAAAGSTTSDLRFSSLATTDLRLFANVGQMPRFIGHEWARNLRVTFAVTNLFDQRQRVRDALGSTPIRYQGPYLDPIGRAFTVGIRKLFAPLPPRGAFRPQR